MRIIKADDLKRVIYEMHIHGESVFLEARSVENLIDGMPTVDPESLRPGSHWEATQFGYNCAACKTDAPSDACGFTVLSRYCPNCGARMEGLQDE